MNPKETEIYPEHCFLCKEGEQGDLPFQVTTIIMEDGKVWQLWAHSLCLNLNPCHGCGQMLAGPVRMLVSTEDGDTLLGWAHVYCLDGLLETDKKEQELKRVESSN